MAEVDPHAAAVAAADRVASDAAATRDRLARLRDEEVGVSLGCVAGAGWVGGCTGGGRSARPRPAIQPSLAQAARSTPHCTPSTQSSGPTAGRTVPLGRRQPTTGDPAGRAGVRRHCARPRPPPRPRLRARRPGRSRRRGPGRGGGLGGGPVGGGVGAGGRSAPTGAGQWGRRWWWWRGWRAGGCARPVGSEKLCTALHADRKQERQAGPSRAAIICAHPTGCVSAAGPWTCCAAASGRVTGCATDDRTAP